MRRVVTVAAAFMAVLAIAPAATAQAETVTVTEFNCESVTVTGSGWEQTEATVEVAVPPSEGGESRDDLVAGPVQVFPDEQGNIAATTLRFKSTPRDGRYAAVVLVDSIVRGQSAGFTLTGCGGALPFTGSSTIPTLAIGLVMLAVGLALVRRNRTSGRSI
jgi:LPXTG-motif cell wall-anchored protein